MLRRNDRRASAHDTLVKTAVVFATQQVRRCESIGRRTTSATADRGSPHLLDYSSTKGAIVTFTRSLALQLVSRSIRVNAVAPGPIWTPLIPSTFSPDRVARFGADVPMQRGDDPFEVAPCYVFMASSDSTYMTGQVLHPNGGEVINA